MFKSTSTQAWLIVVAGHSQSRLHDRREYDERLGSCESQWVPKVSKYNIVIGGVSEAEDDLCEQYSGSDHEESSDSDESSQESDESDHDDQTDIITRLREWGFWLFWSSIGVRYKSKLLSM